MVRLHLHMDYFFFPGGNCFKEEQSYKYTHEYSMAQDAYGNRRDIEAYFQQNIVGIHSYQNWFL